MPKNNQVPDAWDDDWEAQADETAKKPAAQQPAPQDVPMTRAERLAKHAEEQRKLWESAEAPPEFNFIAATSTIPLATPFKNAVKVLSRKPAPKLITKKDPITGLEQLTFQDDDDDDEDESKKHQPTPEEIRMRQQRELEEKQRRYDEARAKIFGDSNPSSGHSTPGNVTPPQSGEGRQNYKGRGGRGRGGGGHRSSNNNNNNNNRQEEQSRRPPSSQPPGTRELFDPSYAPKPGFNLQRQPGNASPQQGSRSHISREEDQSVIRTPRGPDGSGRGGFGFARRGGSQEG